MEQKEKQTVDTPKVTVTVEKNGMKSVSVSEKAGICFLLQKDRVEAVQAYAISTFEMAHLVDAIFRWATKKMMETEGLVELMKSVNLSHQEVEMFPDGETPLS